MVARAYPAGVVLPSSLTFAPEIVADQTLVFLLSAPVPFVASAGFHEDGGVIEPDAPMT
jgi:hypothetical protein